MDFDYLLISVALILLVVLILYYFLSKKNKINEDEKDRDDIYPLF